MTLHEMYTQGKDWFRRTDKFGLLIEVAGYGWLVGGLLTKEYVLSTIGGLAIASSERHRAREHRETIEDLQYINQSLRGQLSALEARVEGSEESAEGK
ncbi:hypothetical protein J4210_05400 [Candidatus Woesearchaeota archaeon]|nr:hypothetical protein [Candidatus Woesearchaeota archaeon]